MPAPAALFTLFLLVLGSVVMGCAGRGQPARFHWAVDEGGTEIVWARTPRPDPMPPIEHAALLVPARIAGLDRSFLFQLDTGHPITVLDETKWRDIASRLGRPAHGPVARLDLRIGTIEVRAEGVQLWKGRGVGVAWDSDTPELIGTLGADFLDGRCVLLDFADHRLRFAASAHRLAPADTRLHPYRMRGRRLLIPAQFEGRAVDLLYDSGSSAFAWLTTRREAERLAIPGSSSLTYTVSSWGKPLTARTWPTAAKVSVCGQELAIGDVSHMDGMGWMQQAAVAVLGLDAMVGNRLFIGRRLLLDTGSRRFALLDPAP